MAQYDDLHPGTITFVGVVSTVLTFVIIVAAQVLYFQYQTLEVQRKEIDAPITHSEGLLKNQQQALNSYAWIDREKGIVSKPIDRAMTEVLSQLQSTAASPAEGASN